MGDAIDGRHKRQIQGEQFVNGCTHAAEPGSIRPQLVDDDNGGLRASSLQRRLGSAMRSNACVSTW